MKKLAEDWAEQWLNSYEGKKETARIGKEFIDIILYGKPIDETDFYIKIEELTVAQIIEKFGYALTEKDIENLKKLRDGK